MWYYCKEMNLSNRMQRVVESQTIAMTKKARELKDSGVDVISLSIGEPDFATPSKICNAAKLALDNGDTHYPPVLGTLPFRKAIQGKLKKDNQIEVDTSQIIVSNGAKQSIFNAVMTVVNPGDEVIIPAPYWVSYPSMVEYAGGVVIEIPTEIYNDFKVSAHQLRSYITDKTKLIIFSSPCNPSGSVMSTEELESWAEVLREFPNILIISDEIYEEIVYVNRPRSLASLVGMQNRVATVNGLSKGFAMTGWRIGYLAGPKEWVAACEKYQGMISSGANTLGQAAGAEALTSDAVRQDVESMRMAFESRRNLMGELLSEIPGVKFNQPDGAFYFFPDVTTFFGKSTEASELINNSDDLALYLLEKAHVATVSGAAFGAPNCLRLSYATSEDQIAEALKRIKLALSHLI
jgi:aspartate aminotransferase